MDQIDKQRLEISLLEVISDWLDDADNNELRDFCVADNTGYFMTQSALAVFFAMEDSQEYLERKVFTNQSHEEPANFEDLEIEK